MATAVISFPILEAGDSTGRRAQRAGAAGREILGDRTRLERATVEQLLGRLKTMKVALQQRLLAGDGSLTDFRRFSLQELLASTDQLIVDATADLADIANGNYQKAAKLGDDHATEPLRAAQLNVQRATPGIDAQLVQAAFGNTVDLLTVPMQQFATDVKMSLRRVALAGDNRFEELARLRDKISGQGFDNASYRAERIIRTELSRTFSEATYGRLVTLSKDFPFLRKGWRDSKDRRVRTGHAEAGKRYARGQGIPIADLFSLNVYDERKGKAPRLIGQASLRFPVDPQATPAGRLAAASTILCRCNSFVDFDLAEFASFTKAKVQVALPSVEAPPPAAAAPEPPPPAPKAKAVRPRAVKVQVKVPKAAAVIPVPAKPKQLGPSGPAVSAALDLAPIYRSSVRLTADMQQKVSAALAEIDKVHGDGNLPKLPVVQVSRLYRKKGMLAYYAKGKFSFKPTELAFSSKILDAQPMMGTFHETGHFLDHVGFNSDITTYASESSDVFAAWRNAAINSKPIKSLAAWKAGNGAPQGVDLEMVDYLLSTKETWARSYAQWLATRGQNAAALAELRNMQKAGTIGPVDPATRYNSTPMGKRPKAGTWEYPWQWSDEEFKPIGEAIDVIMERMGWRKEQ